MYNTWFESTWAAVGVSASPKRKALFLDNILLMKTGTSIHSRPTTAKKAVLSPKLKAEQKMKTEGRDLDLNQLCELMYFSVQLAIKLSVVRRNAKQKGSMLRLKPSKEKQRLWKNNCKIDKWKIFEWSMRNNCKNCMKHIWPKWIFFQLSGKNG